MAYTHLDPGREVEVSSRVYFMSEQMDISPLVRLPPEELRTLEQSSVQKEEAIFEQMEDLAAQWVKQAQETLAARKAQQYLKVPPAPHTSNQWMDNEYGWHERSNMVYKFSWHVYENTRWSKTAQKSVPVSWDLTWRVCCNAPHDADDTGPGRQIAGQSQKRFTDKAVLEKYLQGRIAAYDHLFRDLSPPIPAEHRKRFCVNGVLLPGYTVEASVQEAAASLMEFLEDGDILPKKISRPTPKKPPKPRKHTPTR